MVIIPPSCTCGRVFKIYSSGSDIIDYDEKIKMYFIKSDEGKYSIHYCFGCGEALFVKESKELDEEIRQEVITLSNKIKCIDDVISILGQPDYFGEPSTVTGIGRTFIYNNIWPEISLNLMERKDGTIQFTYSIK